MKNPQIMLDLETLGTTADAVIMSIGAVRFDLDSDEIEDEAFYASVSVDSNLQFKRRIQEDTLIWWLKQSSAAQRVFHEGKQTLGSALDEFADWLGPGQVQIWSNGADFDIPMMAHAYRQHSMDVPWEFWNSRCFRTYKNLPGAKNVKVDQSTGVAHNALVDAMHQAKHLQAIHAALFTTVPTEAARR